MNKKPFSNFSSQLESILSVMCRPCIHSTLDSVVHKNLCGQPVIDWHGATEVSTYDKEALFARFKDRVAVTGVNLTSNK